MVFYTIPFTYHVFSDNLDNPSFTRLPEPLYQQQESLGLPDLPELPNQLESVGRALEQE